MKSAVLPSFWQAYAALDRASQESAQKAFRLWMDNPFHPSLQFKCIDSQERVWSARATRSVRAIGVLDGDTVTWFWIGRHDEYERHFA